MRITDYKRISDLKPSDLILLDSDTEGTRAITALELSKQLNKVLTNSSSTTTVRRMTYRGKNLGNVYTTKQKEAVANGSFDDLFVGDYWVAPNGHTWIIVDFDSFLNTPIDSKGTLLTRHHVVCISGDAFPSATIHSANTTEWYNTSLFTTTLQSKIKEVADFFGATNIVSHQKNSATPGDLTQIDLPTLSMITGCSISDCPDSGFIKSYLDQLPYFTFNIGNTGSLQLQTLNSNSTGFLYIDSRKVIQKTFNAGDRSIQYRPFVVIAGE